MKIDRKEFMAVLNKVSAAISTKDLIPVLACLCFDGKTVFAYDDIIALRFPLDIGVKGALRGKLLLDFLNATRAKEVEVEGEKTQITIKAGKSKFETPMLPEDDFLFRIPEMKKGRDLEVSEKFLNALRKVAPSMSRDVSQPSRYGVTLMVAENGGLTFFSTNNYVAVRATIGKPEGEGKTLILPPRFVEILLEKAKTDLPNKITVAKEWAEARFTSGLRLFCRTVLGANAADYEEVFNWQDKKPKVEIPKGLGHCLERAKIALPHQKDQGTQLTIAKGRMSFLTQSPVVSIKDAIPFEHEDLSVVIHPEYLLAALDHSEKIGLWEDGIRFSGKGFAFLAATVSPDSPTSDEKAEEPSED